MGGDDNYWHGANTMNRHFEKDHVAMRKHHQSLEKLYVMFNKVPNRPTIDAWSEKLKDYAIETVSDACESLYNSKFLPTYQEIREKCQVIKPKLTLADEKRVNDASKLDEETRRYESLKARFIKLCDDKGIDGNEALRKLTENWFKTYMENPERLLNYGLSLNLYEKPALFDFDDKNKKKSGNN